MLIHDFYSMGALQYLSSTALVRFYMLVWPSRASSLLLKGKSLRCLPPSTPLLTNICLVFVNFSQVCGAYHFQLSFLILQSQGDVRRSLVFQRSVGFLRKAAPQGLKLCFIPDQVSIV